MQPTYFITPAEREPLVRGRGIAAGAVPALSAVCAGQPAAASEAALLALRGNDMHIWRLESNQSVESADGQSACIVEPISPGEITLVAEVPADEAEEFYDEHADTFSGSRTPTPFDITDEIDVGEFIAGDH
jgi:hypothetical protein